MSLSYVTITETFAAGNDVPLSGTVIFTPSETVYDASGPLVSADNPITVQVISGVLQSVELLATDNEGLTYAGMTGFFFWSVAIVLGGVSQQGWSFFLPSSPGTVDLYALASTAAGGGFANPMTTPGDLIDGGASGTPERLAIGDDDDVLTVVDGAPDWQAPSPALPLTTLGDTVYEDATPEPARLPGSTSATKMFYTQTGTGSESAAPEWATIASSDISGLALLKTNSLSDVDSVPAARQNLAPWLFDVTDASYGAVGDGTVVIDGAMSTGASATTLTCADSTPFVPDDAGKTVIVNGALAAGSALVTTIATYVSASEVTLTTGCSADVTGAAVLWWSDDTAAIQAAIDDAADYMAEHGYAMVFRPPPPGGVFYGVSGALVNTGDANSQLVIPSPSATSPQTTLHFYAEQGPSVINMWTQTYPQVAGAIVSSGVWDSEGDYSTNYDEFGASAVLGSTPAYPELLPDVDDLPAFANISVVVENWTVVTPSSADGLVYTGINLGGCAKGEFRNCAALITANYSTGSGANQFPGTGDLQNGPSRGLIFPYNSNNDHALARACYMSGYAFGFQAGEHAYLEDCKVVGCCFIANLSGNDGATSGHLVKIIGMSAEANSNGFFLTGGGESEVGYFIDADIDLEGLSANSCLIADNDSGASLSTLFGQVRVWGSYGLNIFPPLYPASVKLLAMGPAFGGIVPGWTFSYGGFSSAGTNVPVQNPYWRDVLVTFGGGTVTTVKAGATLGGSGGSAGSAPTMTATGLSGSGLAPWPSGGWLSFTWTGSPTWDVCIPT